MRSLAKFLRVLASALFAWFLIQTALFALVQIAPGGPAAALAGDYATVETQAAIASSFALDEPVITRYAVFVWRMGHADWGRSYHFRRPVADLIAERLMPTALLMLAALAIGALAGYALGLQAAAWPRGGIVVAMVATATYALPVFWVGQLLMLTFGAQLQWLPIAGLSDPRHDPAGWPGLLDTLRHAVLPVLTLALQQAGYFGNIVFTKSRLELGQGYVRAAQARGIRSASILRGHVARNVAPQLAAAVLNRLGLLFTGAVLVETLFAWPGLGRLLTSALLNRDHPLLLGVFGLITATVILSSAVADLIHARLDPRVSAESRT